MPGKAGGPVKIYAKSGVNAVGAASAGGLRSRGGRMAASKRMADGEVGAATFDILAGFEVFDCDFGFLFLHKFLVVIWFGFASCFSPRITTGLHP